MTQARSHVRLRDGRTLPLAVPADEAEAVLAAARSSGSEFVQWPSAVAEGTVNVQLLTEVDKITPA